MHRSVLVLCALSALGLAQPASAGITIAAGNNPLPNSNVTFADQGPATTILGSFDGATNDFAVTGTTVGGGTQLVASGGIITGSGANITSVNFVVPNGGLYGEFIFNLTATASGQLFIDIVGDQGSGFGTFFALGNGQNFFTIDTSGGESLQSVTVTATSGSIASVRNLRADLVALGVPEPGTWAMMLLGFAGIGCVMRRERRRTAAVALS